MREKKINFYLFSLYYISFQDSALDVSFHPSGAAIGSANSGGAIKIYDLRTGLLSQHYHAHTGAVNKAKFHPNGNFMLTASDDGTMKVNLMSPEIIIQLNRKLQNSKYSERS